MSNRSPISEWLLRTSEMVHNLDLQMQHNGVKRHYTSSFKEALLGTKAIIESVVEVIDEQEKEKNAEAKPHNIPITD